MDRRPGAQRPPSLSDGRFFFGYALLLAIVVAGACIVFAFPHRGPACDEALVSQFMPRRGLVWSVAKDRSVVLPRMGGFHVARGEPPLEVDEFLVEDGVCPGQGARLEPLDATHDIHIRRSPGSEEFLVTEVLDPSTEIPILRFRSQPRLALVIPPELTLELVALFLASAVAIVWGIARARRRLRLADALLDPERFAEATCEKDGTLRIGESAVVVRGAAPGTTRAGRVVVRMARESGGDYRTPPTAHVADVFRGDRRQASDRELRRASLILSAFTALTISIAIVAGILSVNAWVSQQEAERAVFSRRKSLRDARIDALVRCDADGSCPGPTSSAR